MNPAEHDLTIFDGFNALAALEDMFGPKDLIFHEDASVQLLRPAHVSLLLFFPCMFHCY